MSEIGFAERGNAVERVLTLNDRPMKPDEIAAITEVTVKVAGKSFSSNVGSDPVEFNDGVYRFYPGRMGLEPGGYRVHVTVYTAEAPDGLAWELINVVVRDWPQS